MHDLTQRAAYIQGLAEGLDLGRDSKEGKVLNSMIDLLQDLAHSVSDLRESHTELETYVETLDEDLYDLEDEVYEDGVMGLDDDDEDFVEVECPSCHETVSFDSDVLEDDDILEVTCPNCDTVVFINDETLDYVDPGVTTDI